MSGEWLGALDDDVKAYKEYARSVAQKEGIPEGLFLGYFEHESSWNPYAKNPNSSATGLGQILDDNPWAKKSGLNIIPRGKKGQPHPDDERLNPYKNIDAIALEMKEKNKGNWEHAVRNTGEGHQSYLNRVLNVARTVYGYLGPSQAMAAESPKKQIVGEYLGPIDENKLTNQIQESQVIGEKLTEEQPVSPKLSLTQEIVKSVLPYGRPLIEFGGLLGGAALATPGTYGLGTVAGAGLGYAAGKQATSALETYAGLKEAPKPEQVLKEAVSDVPTGMAMEAGGAIGSKLIAEPIANWLSSKMAPRLYESALKIPPSVPQDIRSKAIQTGIEGKYLPNQKSLNRLELEMERLNTQVKSVIDEATTQGKIINTDKVLSRVDDLKQFYQNLPDPSPYLKYIDEAKEAIKAYRGENIPVGIAQEIKKNLYVNLRKAYGEMKSITKEFDKSVARGIKEELEGQIPELASLNKDLSNKINLEQILERSVHRIRNYDIIRLGDTVAASAGAAAKGPEGLGIAYLTRRVLESPEVKSRLAFILSKSSGLTGKYLSRLITYGALNDTEKSEK